MGSLKKKEKTSCFDIFWCVFILIADFWKNFSLCFFLRGFPRVKMEGHEKKGTNEEGVESQNMRGVKRIGDAGILRKTHLIYKSIKKLEPNIAEICYGK
jgi:hypothetical protein